MSRTKRFFNDVILGTVNSSDITIRTGSESMTSSPATIMSNTPFDETKPDRIAVATTCVKHLAETLGRIIPFVYRMDSKKGKVKAKEHYLYDLIHYQPNSWTNSHTFYQTLEYHRNFKGNAYALIKRNEATGRAEAFEVITPSRVKGSVKEKGELYYLIVNEKGDKVEPVNSSDILHFRMMSADGVFGFNPIRALAANMSITHQGEKSLDSFYKNNAMSPRAFKSIGAGAAAKKLRDEAKKEFAKDHAGAHNAGKEIWLPANTEIQDLSISIADAQILESLKQSSNQIAAMYGVPAFKATGDTTTSKFNSIEQIQLDFKQNVSAITSMYRREFESKLLTEGDKNNEVSIESNEDILISPDTKTKGEYMKTLFMTGSISPKTIATIANQPSEGLSDETYIPVNMQSVRVYEAKNKNPQPELIVEPSQTKKDTKPKSNEDE